MQHHATRFRLRFLAFAFAVGVIPLSCGDSGDDDSSADACPGGQTACGDTCVNLGTNAANCGACGNVCSTAELCVAGECTCGDGYTSCSGSCVELAFDPDHCGDCDTQCSGSQVCSQGACSADCAEGETNCDRSCVDLQTDALHCGDCDTTCASGQACANGECTCGEGGRLCGGSCVQTETDPSNCGACGVRCGEGEGCVDGSCRAAPPNQPVVTASCTEAFAEDASCTATAAGTTYYVSTSGDDAYDGRSEDSPIQTLARASEIAAQPGDRILFKCGDVWRDETLVIGSSGAECQHIVYGSYPAACTEQPRFSGSVPIVEWTQGSDGVWVADLGAGENAGRFPNGINQLFRGDRRLPLGRWPNLDDPGFEHGYSRIETNPSGDVLGDSRLPDVDWTGATLRYFSIRWLLLNLQVTSSSEGFLTLSSDLDCYDGCGSGDLGDPEQWGWGYMLTNHRATLDQQDEWYYDARSDQVFLVSGAAPADISGSVIPAGISAPESPTNDEGFRGLVELGPNMESPIHHVVIENLRVENGWRHGIATPINQVGGENSDLVVRCNTVRNVDGRGMNFATWVVDAPRGQNDGWYGGNAFLVAANVVSGANHYGIFSLLHDSTIQDNLVADTGLIENLNESGLGCDVGDANCTENGDGIDLPRYDENPIASINLTVRRNRIERAGYCGIDIFGDNVLAEENVVLDTCYSKGDCGAFRTYGATATTLRRNIIRRVISPLDGFSSNYYERFGFGLYIDTGSEVTSEGNTIEAATGYGIIYQTEGTTGDVTGNTLYGTTGRTMVFAGFDGTIESFTGNTLVATSDMRLLFTEANGTLGTSDENTFIQPYTTGYIAVEIRSDWSWRSLAEWQAASGKDMNSVDAWYTQAEGETPRAELFVNDTDEAQTIGLDRAYVDLAQQAVVGSLVLEPYTSKVLVAEE
ncbi:MAG: right-handed parallel beta-helix repeat-containing protein [Polyangiaceae bacterium]|nr:right-handed parallel beta-helix repeat-containing protein [Polyangiaceae bacterium]